MEDASQPECFEASLKDSENKNLPIRLVLFPDALLVQKQEWINVQLDEEDEVFLNMVRDVEVEREPGAGFGLCVKGGSEHRLPVLISRILKGEAADRSGQLLVGDAILRVNGVNVESCTHDEVVALLKDVTEDTVSLSVRHFRPASYFLNKGNEVRGLTSSKQEHLPLSSLPRLEKEWLTAITIPLLYARLSKYVYGTDKLRENSFDVIGVDGSKSGPIYFPDRASLDEWYLKVSCKTQGLLLQMISMTNQLMTKDDHIQTMCWAHERLPAARQTWQVWKEKFLALKAADIYVFDVPPMHASDWSKCAVKFKVYECMLKVTKDCDLFDARQHCCVIQTGAQEVVNLSFDGRAELLAFEKAWHRTSNLAVQRLGSKTFGCKWQGHLSGLVIDLDQGFSLFDHHTKSVLWSYRFAQLKSSSDDGVSSLTLNFQNDTGHELEKQVVECSDLQTLIYSIHAFLSAKLSTVDPSFLGNH